MYLAGSYAYLDLKDDSLAEGDRAMMYSPFYTPDFSSLACLSFWYHIDDKDVGSINAYVWPRYGNLSETLWTISGNRADNWWYAGVTMMSEESFQAVIEGVVGSGSLGGITIDDVAIESGACDPRGHCSFEKNACSWQSLADDGDDDEVPWLRKSGRIVSSITGPTTDHTTGSREGYYMNVDATGTNPGDRATLFSEVFDPADSCFTFWYHMKGYGSVNLTASYLQFDPPTEYDPVVMLTVMDGQGDLWQYGQFDITSNTEFQVVLQVTIGEGGNTDVAVDDTALYTTGVCGTPHPLKCDFEDGECDYMNGGVLWRRIQGSTPSLYTGPSFDHTLNSAAGYFMYLEASTGAAGDSATLTSPAVEPGTYCLQFWYHMFGSAMGSLNVHIQPNGTTSRSLAWSHSGDSDDVWHSGTVDLVQLDVFQVVYEAVRGTSYTSDISIDDLDLTEGACPATQECNFQLSSICGYTQELSLDDFDWSRGAGGTGTGGTGPTLDHTYDSPTGYFMYIEASLHIDCNFESGFCLWENAQTGDYSDWVRLAGRTSTGGTGPTVDHTLGTAAGFYIYFESNYAQPGYTAVLYSAPLHVMDPNVCLTFWYHMYGSTIGELSFMFEDFTTGQQAYGWRMTGLQIPNEDTWLPGKVGLADYFSGNITIPPEGEELLVLIIASLGDYSYGDIALDDMLVEYESCSFSPDEADPNNQDTVFCDFEYNMCGWKQDTDDNFDWVRRKGSTPSSNTGPLVDHTTGSGFYMYFEASQGSGGSTARVRSSPLASTPEGACISFWLHMFGQSMGTLKVSLYNSLGEEEVVWKQEGTLQNMWLYRHITLHVDYKYEIAFEAVRGYGWSGDMAVDDIEYDATSTCPELVWCTFEEERCDWGNVFSGDNMDWVLYSGSTPSGSTGPTNDHTLKNENGHYIYIEASSSGDGHTALFDSTYVDARLDGCFTFWYHMYGQDTGTLRVYQTIYPETDRKEIWSKAGEQGNTWLLAEVDTTAGSYHKFTFEGVDGMNYAGDIAIDDIEYRENACDYVAPPTTPAPTPTPYQFSPWDCTFEDQTLCSWTQGTNDDFDWQLQSGSTPSVGTGPPADHTTQTINGYYVVIDASSAGENQRARLYSDDITEGEHKCLAFWYHMYGAHVGDLTVGYGDTDGTPDGAVIWSMSGTQDYSWTIGLVSFTATDDHPKVYFEATATAGNQGDIALDDIFVLDGYCPPQVFCDFTADDSCGYQNDDTDELDWKRDRAFGSFGNRPLYDHTSGAAEGFYMIISPNNRISLGDSGRLLSPSYSRPFGGTSCARFWYMISDTFGTFTVEALYSEDGSLIPTGHYKKYTDPTNRFWTQGTLEVTSDYDNIFSFELTVDTLDSSGEYVAIDDVMVLSVACTEQLATCDFETDMCDWANTQNGDELDWLRHTGSTDSQDTGPLTDHTTGTISGWYMYIDSGLGARGSRARLESSSIEVPNSAVCFSLWYHMKCADDSLSTIFISWETAWQVNTITSISASSDDLWIYRQMNFYVTEQYKMLIEGVLAESDTCDIAIDDLYLFNGVCSGTATPAPPFECDSGDEQVDGDKVCDMYSDCTDDSDEASCGTCTFESNPCNYTSDPDGLLPWIWQGVGSGTPPPNLLVPSDDFDGSAGSYMVVDNTQTPKAGAEYARLVSPEIKGVSSGCSIQLWYYLSGSDELKVSYKTSPTEETILYRAATPIQGSWQAELFTVGRIRNPFQFHFLGKPHETAPDGVIAVSDVRLFACSFPNKEATCQGTDFTCSNKGCIFDEDVCNFDDDCGDYSDEFICDAYTARCNFEVDQCAYTNHPTSQFMWYRMSAAIIPDHLYAPTRDHTTNSVGGFYMVADFLLMNEIGDSAILVSPTFQATGLVGSCQMRFFLFGHGSDRGIVNIYTRTETYGVWTLVESYANFFFDSYSYFTESVSAGNSDFQVVIQAVATTGPNAAIAIDDISFENCPLASNPLPHGSTTPVPTTLAPCPVSTDFQCGDGQCVSQGLVCDFKEHCTNGMDEKICDLIYSRCKVSKPAQVRQCPYLSKEAISTQ
ncbi:MAM and LDL-receptor class A domain-containing protein 1-like [Diadema setosum]|uniref:MAM and LDL-receptor class A domain-containing protein 1-like n=1 Tax=Diadema setosum TaxID=31175 RepID=UPI003B3B1649